MSKLYFVIIAHTGAQCVKEENKLIDQRTTKKKGKVMKPWGKQESQAGSVVQLIESIHNGACIPSPGLVCNVTILFIKIYWDVKI